MKSYINTLALGLFLLLTGCDIIEGPYINPDIVTPDSTTVKQKVLLEKFTGHQCPYCPEGAQIAHNLKDYYGDRLVVVAYHAGWFARTSTDFPDDYRTEAGTELNQFFGINEYPTGLVNRINAEVLGRSEWGTAIATEINNEPKLKLSINSEYNSSSRAISVDVSVDVIMSCDPLNVCVIILENGVVSPQKTSDGVIDDYVHNNMFRRALNGVWGTSIFEDGAMAGDSQNVIVGCTIESSWDESNIEIVAYAYSINSGEIVQVESMPLL